MSNAKTVKAERSDVTAGSDVPLFGEFDEATVDDAIARHASSTSAGLADSNREHPPGDAQTLISQRSGFPRVNAGEEVKPTTSQ